MEVKDPRYSAACYILAVMLERKRILKVKEQLKRDGKRVFVYEHPKSGDFFTITDPDLQLDQLEQVQTDVADVLEHGIPQKDAPIVDQGLEAPLEESNSAEQTAAEDCGCEASESAPVPEAEQPVEGDQTEKPAGTPESVAHVMEPNPV